MGFSVERQERYHVKGVRESKIEEGSLVWYHYLPSARRKLSKFWQGPYVIEKKLSDVTYLIKRGEDGKGRVVHIDNLKLCLSEAPRNMARESVAETSLGRGCRSIHPPERYFP